MKNIELSELKENINQIRDILNEVSCTSESDENDKEKLLISEYLDKLIVKYMKTVQKL
ncbi:Spo0E family sporulation regulatory protein-aspartic acid phosphatase [Clostridium sp. JN-9]|nr:Spo0E family sporulation regulatory protein-aspartic acid phosphatase [Clostridium sp. JN-9]